MSDDTLLLIKPADIPRVLESFNKFDRHLKFTVETFENELPHLLPRIICYLESPRSLVTRAFENLLPD